jgi:hypothetical protein
MIGPTKPVRQHVQGFGGNVAGLQKGTIEWSIEDDEGKVHTIRLPNSYYAPTAPSRLLSPQHWSQTANDHKPHNHGTWCATYDDSVELYWDQRRYHRTIPLDPATNVASFRSAPGFTRFNAYCASIVAQVAVVSDDEEGNDRIMSSQRSKSTPKPTVSELPVTVKKPTSSDTKPQPPKSTYIKPKPPIITTNDFFDIPAVIEEEEIHIPDPEAALLRWHHRLGHLSFKRLRLMAREGDIPKQLANCRVPMCSGCMYGKATKRPWRTKTPPNEMRIPTITGPGCCVSVDQLVSTTPGIIAQLKGIPTTKRYTVATIFVDHYSRLSYVYLQKTSSSAETVQAKKAFETYCKTYHVRVLHYHADNGRFADNAFRADVEDKRQTISYCGVNAHFQNGIAEKRIRDLQDAARTMLLHAKHRWPNAITTNLWPYALRTANEINASTPNLTDGISPLEKFSGTKVKPKFRHFHTFGCPAYVLDNNLQGGASLPKWDERARVGIYLGPSLQHARSIALILNLTTGHTSPQFHAAFDDEFTTTRGKGQILPVSNWQRVAGFTKLKTQALARPTSVREGAITSNAYDKIPAISPVTRGAFEEAIAGYLQDDVENAHGDDNPDMPDNNEQQIPDLDHDNNVDNNDTQVPPPRRSSRTPVPSRRFLEGLETDEYMVAYETLMMGEGDFDDQDQHPLIAFATSTDPDVMHLGDALRQPDRHKFIEAMEEEVQAQIKNKFWEIVPRTEVPQGMKVLPAVWSMRRKRRIDTREVYKWKARLTVHGGMQEHGVNYWETYSPVVKWSSIRFFMIMSLLAGWHTRQLDFVLAYPQADVECELYMEIPKCYNYRGQTKAYVLKLLKNVYGQKQAGRVWNQHLVKGLTDIGFVQSLVDECVFYKDRCVFLVYVDDTILCGPTKLEVDAIVALLTKSFNISDEGDMSDYLGVKVNRLDNNIIEMTQPHLIQQIIDDLGLQDNSKEHTTPARADVVLHRDLDGEPFDESWSYRSVIGKLNFLEKSTRPDIALAVHQCARYSSNPKKSHGEAVKRIGRYLKSTKDKGMYLNPQRRKETTFDCWVDASFAGDWYQPDAMDNPLTAKSRTGYVIMYANCLILWASRIQTEIALSTTEAEYVALSQALREVIPLMNLIEEAIRHGIPLQLALPNVNCTVFEDNTGALEMARAPKMRPRTKHINIKYHHFREHVRNGQIVLQQVDTKEQLADVFTKPLPYPLFKMFREKILGW